MKNDEQSVGAELMREGGIAVEGAGAVASMGRVDIGQVTKDLEQKMLLIDRIHQMIHSKIDPETDIKKIGDKFRRTINFARKCYRIVGGSISWWSDPLTGMKYKRESQTDEQGNWYAITVSCTYMTPWGEKVEAFKRMTSREAFFGESQGNYREGSDVCETDIVEMAVSEAFKSAVFTALGFPKDISPAELAKCKVDGAKATGHEFKGATGAQGGNSSGSQEEYDQRKQIEMACKTLAESGWNNCATPLDVLKEATKNPEKGWNGWGSFKAIKDTQLPRIHSHLTKLVESISGSDKGKGDDSGIPF